VRPRSASRVDGRPRTRAWAGVAGAGGDDAWWVTAGAPGGGPTGTRRTSGRRTGGARDGTAGRRQRSWLLGRAGAATGRSRAPLAPAAGREAWGGRSGRRAGRLRRADQDASHGRARGRRAGRAGGRPDREQAVVCDRNRPAARRAGEQAVHQGVDRRGRCGPPVVEIRGRESRLAGRGRVRAGRRRPAGGRGDGGGGGRQAVEARHDEEGPTAALRCAPARVCGGGLRRARARRRSAVGGAEPRPCRGSGRRGSRSRRAPRRSRPA